MSLRAHIELEILTFNNASFIVILLMPKQSSEKQFNDQTHKSRAVDFVAMKNLSI